MDLLLNGKDTCSMGQFSTALKLSGKKIPNLDEIP